uniref:Uncharacterized protein n=1 Tax=viral metagenome TaxID=1070528 RepID=A0A6C0CF31_9ZZZZ
MATPSWNLIPNAWLLHFSRTVKSSLVRKLMVSKKYRKELTRNSAWLIQCEELPDFHELTEYERYTMIQEEGFWYEWYNDHCPRFVPIAKPVRMNFRTNFLSIVLVPEVGSIAYDGRKTFVCINVVRIGAGKSNAGLPEKISWAPCSDHFNVIFNKKHAKTKKMGILVSTLRTYGNYSIELSLPGPEYYK